MNTEGNVFGKIGCNRDADQFLTLSLFEDDKLISDRIYIVQQIVDKIDRVRNKNLYKN